MLQGLLGIFSGLITPVQTAVNTRLGRSIGSPLRASLVSFSVGLIAMLTLTLLLGPYPLIPATAANGPWWMWFAGVFGVTFLTGNVLLLPKLGSLKTVIMPVTGQIVMGLLIDAFGWFGTTAQPISPLRIAGAAITLVGFLLAVAGPNLRLRPAIDRPAGGSENSGDSEKSETDGKAVHVPGSATVLWSCAGIAFGMCSAVQTALLGKLGVALGSPVKASLASFVVGLISLAIVVAFVDRTYSLGDALKKRQSVVDVGRRIAGCDAGDVQRVPVRAYRHRHDGDAGIARSGRRRIAGRPFRPAWRAPQARGRHPIRRRARSHRRHCAQGDVIAVSSWQPCAN